MALTEIPIELSSTPSIVDGGNAMAITIDSSENVGIGVSPLTLSGNAAPGLTVSSNGPFILLQDANNADKVRYISNNTGELQFGIVDDDGATGKTEHMRIDASGNLLIGQSSTTLPGVGNTTAGVSIRGDDGSFFSRALGSGDTNNVVSVNRSTADGNILGFQKDGTTVGSIGTAGAALVLGNGNAGLYFNSSLSTIMPWGITGNTNRDAAIDIGQSSNRFKDLYLSGGVVFGSTSSAVTSKTLDDYEEGTCTISLLFSTTNATITQGNTFVGSYTRVGNVCTVVGYTGARTFQTTGAGNPRFSGLPFAGKSGIYGVAHFTHNTFFTNSTAGYTEAGSNYFYPITDGGLGVATIAGTGTRYIMFSLTYLTA